MELDRRYLQTQDPFVAEDLRQMEYAGKYNSWIFSLLQPYIGKRILEIGPGIGNLTKFIIQKADYLEGIEPNPICAEMLRESFKGQQNFSVQEITVEDWDVPSLEDKQFDTLVCVNVLEHINDDLTALSQFRKILQPNGTLVLLVPAVPWAYGPIDAALGHFRRYSIKPLSNLLITSGFQIISAHYSNLFGLMGWTVNAHFRKAVKQNDTQIKLFDSLVPVISRVEKMIKPPLGLSIIAIGRKG
jgi:SAM-dependent methyltransferase